MKLKPIKSISLTLIVLLSLTILAPIAHASALDNAPIYSSDSNLVEYPAPSQLDNLILSYKFDFAGILAYEPKTDILDFYLEFLFYDWQISTYDANGNITEILDSSDTDSSKENNFPFLYV